MRTYVRTAPPSWNDLSIPDSPTENCQTHESEFTSEVITLALWDGSEGKDICC